MSSSGEQIRAAEVVLPCAELSETLEFFTSNLGFRVEAIFPADDPATAVIAGHGLRIRLERGRHGPPGHLRLLCHDPDDVAGGAVEIVAPNGTRIELARWDPPVALPELKPALVISRASAPGQWGVGRAGMRYRDLIPDRQGGRFIASHIHIPDGGPVPDYVHFHKIRFQMIYCYKGWVRLVYEDQGPPFVLRAGDCVLQPPGIRHRVLESSPGLEVIEIGSPAEHETLADHAMALPTPTARAERDFAGQRFVRHEAAAATWQPWRDSGFEHRDTGIAAATGGVAGVGVVRPALREGGDTKSASARSNPCSHGGELLFMIALCGALTLRYRGESGAVLEEALGPGDSFTIPAGLPHQLSGCSESLELLEVTLPAELEIRPVFGDGFDGG